MKNLINFLNMALIGKEFLGGILLKKVVSKATKLIMLTLISSMMICMLLIFSLYLAYDFMLRSGMDTNYVLTIISLTVIIFMLISINFAVRSYRSLKALFEINIKPESEISRIIEAFKNGLLNK